jgi:hypothetical protein
MANEALVAVVKEAVGLMKAGKTAEAHAVYIKLFGSPEFASYRPEDQRQAIRLVVITKGVAPHNPAASLVEAHRAALGPLTELVSQLNDPADYELLGVCHVVLGNEAAAGNIFREGLRLERARDAGSTLCGSLMKWASSV